MVRGSSNIDLVNNDPRVPPFDFSPTGFGGIAFANSDLAFTGDHAIVGNFNGFQVYASQTRQPGPEQFEQDQPTK